MKPPAKVVLLSAAAATGSGIEVSAGYYNWSVYGTWDSATAQLQWSPDAGTTWIDVDGVSLTANGGWTEVPIAFGLVRASISGAGGSTSLSSLAGGVA